MDMLVQTLGVNFNPLTTDQFLGEWERDFALPDECGDAGNITNRKQALLTIATFNATKALLEEHAALYGLAVRVEEQNQNEVKIRLPSSIQVFFRRGQARSWCGWQDCGIWNERKKW